ncbi:MAG TPA: rhamnulokinase family protein [Pirellulales bacterium]
MSDEVYLAVDLGASSGRVVAGLFDGNRLTLEELHRFENAAVPIADSLHWDVLRLWDEIRRGLRLAAGKFGGQVRSCGIDAWGVDFALLARGDTLLGNPHSYRDRRCDGILAQVLERVPRSEIFAQTGLQFLPINTLFQLVAMRVQGSPLLDLAETFLMMPDLFHWLLTGVKTNEATNASTTQFYNPQTKDWARDLLQRLDLPKAMLGPLSEPGTNLGRLRPAVATETGLTHVDVILPPTHDTASAVMAVPALSQSLPRPDWCYISCGTWSLMGVELPGPVINEKCLGRNFTNERGVGGTTRLLKNITGLWLVQECRRKWSQAGHDYTWDALNRLALEAPPLRSFVDPDDAAFLAPADMPAAIAEYCRRTSQNVPETPGEVIRVAIESLALKSRVVLAALEDLVGSRLETIHIVGGGSQNHQLCQATADACGRRVVAGPTEATAIGNVLLQAMAAGKAGSVAQAREIVARSFSTEQYEPRDADRWQAAFERFRSACGL